MATENKPVVSTFWFNADIDKLVRKYPKVTRQLEELVDQLEQGHYPGDRMRGVRGAMALETRMKNPDARKGSSGGFRIVYYVGDDRITLLAISTRSKPEKVSSARIANILKDLDLS